MVCVCVCMCAQAYLPQVALIVFLSLLPSLLMALSRMEGIPSQSHLVRAASGKYFYFIIFNVFLGVTLFGTIFSSLDGFKALLSSKNFSVSSVITLFGTKLPPVAAYFITFVALQYALHSPCKKSFTKLSFTFLTTGIPKNCRLYHKKRHLSFWWHTWLCRGTQSHCYSVISPSFII